MTPKNVIQQAMSLELGRLPEVFAKMADRDTDITFVEAAAIAVLGAHSYLTMECETEEDIGKAIESAAPIANTLFDIIRGEPKEIIAAVICQLAEIELMRAVFVSNPKLAQEVRKAVSRRAR